MPNLLAIDTSSANCTVALQTADTFVSETLDSGGHTAQQVLTLVARVLQKANFTLPAIDAIAVMAGPGSFTGIRIGIGAAQGLSLANGTPVIPLSILALKALAAIKDAGGTDRQQVLVADIAREGELYFAAYGSDHAGGVVLIGEEQVGAPQELVIAQDDNLPTQTWLGAGNGWLAHPDLPAVLNVDVKLPAFDSALDSALVCEFAQLRLQQGAAVPAEQALPNYVKDTLDYKR